MPEKIRVYLDNCCFNRPFDDQKYLTVRLETEAKLFIQEKIKSNELGLGWSYILDFENNANPFEERKDEIWKWKEIADSYAVESEYVLNNMEELTSFGIKPVDALHIACSISLNCNYFLTVDKEIIRKSSKITSIIIENPVNFIMEWETINEK